VVFCNTKQLCREVCEHLGHSGISAGALHGDMEQRDREQMLIQFKQQSLSVLVATDVAARGLDINELPAVINFELPRDSQVYVHRIGRTGRAGKSGLALSLFADSERHKLSSINDYLKSELKFEALASLPEPTGDMPEPVYTTLCIAGGRKEKVRPGDILGAITKEAGIDGKAVGKIDVMDYAAYVAIERNLADQTLGRLLNGKIKGRKFKVRKL
jgi:ATP-independent RNA helicase DbpA